MAEMTPNSRIFVAGHRGLVGSAVVRRLEDLGYTTILTATRDQLDLRDQADRDLSRLRARFGPVYGGW